MDSGGSLPWRALATDLLDLQLAAKPISTMREILQTEDYVPVPPNLLSDPFYRMTYLIKEEIRKYKWIEGEKGRQLTWAQARDAWIAKHQKDYEDFFRKIFRGA